jgi:hypothetical protein
MRGLDLFNQVSIYKPRSMIIRFVQIRQDLYWMLLNSHYWIERCRLLQRLAPVNLISGERSRHMNSVASSYGVWSSSPIGDRYGSSPYEPVPLEANRYSSVPRNTVVNYDQFHRYLWQSKVCDSSFLHIYYN